MTKIWILLLLFAYYTTCYGQAPIPAAKQQKWNETWTDKIKKDLLLGYDKFARPNEKGNGIIVDVSMTMYHFDVDEEKSMLNVIGWFKMSWNDNKLQWNPNDYNGVQSIHVGDHEIWQPDIMLYNSATGSSVEHFGHTHCIVFYNGTVLWVPPTSFTSFCDLNLKYWPFDRHTCGLKFGSWTYNGEEIDIVVNDKSVINEMLMENHQWKIINSSTYRESKLYDCCVEPYTSVEFKIEFERRSPMFKAVVLTPATIVILLTLVNFWLPPQSGEKILLNGINGLMIVLFLIYFAQKLPIMAAHTPLVVLFYSSTLYLVTFSTILSVIVINLSRTKQIKAVPWFIKKQLDGCLGTVLLLKQSGVEPLQSRAEELRDQPFDEHQTSDNHRIIEQTNSGKAENGSGGGGNGSGSGNNGGPIQQHWILFAMAIDRIAFLVYCLIFSILAIVYAI